MQGEETLGEQKNGRNKSQKTAQNLMHLRNKAR
jgi:hypothetical protein